MRFLRSVCILLISSISIVACANQQQGTETQMPKLSLQLEIDAARLGEGEIILLARLTNNGGQAIEFLPWNTPLEGRLMGDYLTVMDQGSGKRLEYRGRMVKRAAPTGADYVTVAPGAAVLGATDLTASYNFCGNTGYTISADPVLNSKSAEPIAVSGNPVRFVTPGTLKCEQ